MGFFIVMPRVVGVGGVTKLSELIIDTDKDWARRIIKNLGEPVDAGDALRLPLLPSHLGAVDTPAHREVPSYNAEAGKFEWIPVGAGSKIIAASNSLDKSKADYVCDGVDDQEEINAAISEMSLVGGRVLLLEGTYNITGSINLASNIALVGEGPGTVLRIPDGLNAYLVVIYGSNVSRVLVENLRVDGNRENQSSGQMRGIYFTNTTHSKVANCWMENLSDVGIFFGDGCNNNIITANVCQGSELGIDFAYAGNIVVAGNICRENSYGIYSYNLHGSIITGNICQGNGRNGIYIDTADNNVVVGNSVLGNSQEADNSYDGIYVTCFADYNLISGNVVRHQGLAKQHRFGIRIDSGDCWGNLVHGNDLYQAGKSADFSDVGNGTIYRNNRTTEGWVP